MINAAGKASIKLLRTGLKFRIFNSETKFIISRRNAIYQTHAKLQENMAGEYAINVSEFFIIN